jgi:hypothetical protein
MHFCTIGKKGSKKSMKIFLENSSKQGAMELFGVENNASVLFLFCIVSYSFKLFPIL